MLKLIFSCLLIFYVLFTCFEDFSKGFVSEPDAKVGRDYRRTMIFLYFLKFCLRQLPLFLTNGKMSTKNCQKWDCYMVVCLVPTWFMAHHILQWFQQWEGFVNDIRMDMAVKWRHLQQSTKNCFRPSPSATFFLVLSRCLWNSKSQSETNHAAFCSNKRRHVDYF